MTAVEPGDPTGRPARVAAAVLGAPLVTLLVVLGLGLRAYVLASPLGSLDGDEAVSGLMARHVLDGELDRFFWGQVYGGTLEQLLTAGAFLLTGGSSVLVLKLVPVLLSAACAVVVWRIGLRLLGPEQARLAGALMWVWPATFVWWSTKSRGFFWLGLLLGLLVLLLTLRVASGGSRRDWLLLGLCAGLGWWETAQTVFFLAPALLWLCLRARRTLLRGLPFAAAGAVVGALPWLQYNVVHPLASIRTLPPAPGGEGTYGERLEAFFVRGLPMALGLKVPYTDVWVVAETVCIVLLVAAAVYAGGLLSQRPRHVELLLLIVVLLPFLYAAGPGARDVREGRYLLPLLPVAALLLVAWTRAGWQRLGLAAVLVGITVAALPAMELSVQPRESSRRLPVDMAGLVAAADGLGVRHAYADYWIAYRLTFESRERVVAVPFFVDRHPEYRAEVDAAPNPAWVYVLGSNDARSFELATQAAGVGVVRTDAGGYVIYQPQSPLRPGQLPQVSLPDPEPFDVPASNG